MIKLDVLDRKLLFELDLNSRATYKELASKLHVAQETIRFRVNRLQEQGYIKNFITTMNTSYLNRYYYKLFYKFHQITPQQEQEIVQFILKYKSMAYVASTEGHYDITFLILAKEVHDLYNFLIPFRKQFGDFILEQDILIMTTVHRFNLRFFHPTGKLLHTKYPEQLVEPKVDRTDYVILNELARNSRLSLIDLAKITNTETNVVKYRIKKLRMQKIIGTNVLEINFEKFGLEHFQVNFKLKNYSIVNSIINYVAQNPKATFATVTLGKYDLALEFAVGTIRELRNILNDIQNQYAEMIIDHDVFILYEHSINWFPYSFD